MKRIIAVAIVGCLLCLTACSKSIPKGDVHVVTSVPIQIQLGEETFTITSFEFAEKEIKDLAYDRFEYILTGWITIDMHGMSEENKYLLRTRQALEFEMQAYHSAHEEEGISIPSLTIATEDDMWVFFIVSKDNYISFENGDYELIIRVNQREQGDGNAEDQPIIKQDEYIWERQAFAEAFDLSAPIPGDILEWRLRALAGEASRK